MRGPSLRFAAKRLGSLTIRVEQFAVFGDAYVAADVPDAPAWLDET